ncbi:hypothetical protein SASPL_108442 [Salvia splendens]|uniref:Uncharacterized protein n=1 Tax=Salvia splendens TaxID=180675 RepID=A0A8X9A679_SALSN|nr:hypothetical protein SASPL_108442 [Salvia splendens]
MSAWVYASVDSVRGKNQKGEALWLHVQNLYHVFPDNENVAYEQDGSNSKRTKTSESDEYTIPSNPETPTSGHSTSSRPIELHALRLAKDNENKLVKTRLQIEREKLEKPSMKMYQKMLIKLLDKEHLSPEDQEMKHRLMEIVFGK